MSKTRRIDVKTSIVAAVAAFGFGIAVTAANAQTPQIYAPDGTYLGNLNSNQFDPNSVSNPYGRYGNPYSPDSINNPLGQYGSPFSPNSVNNPFATGGSGRRGRGIAEQ
jgi:hypothetical protein